MSGRSGRYLLRGASGSVTRACAWGLSGGISLELPAPSPSPGHGLRGEQQPCRPLSPRPLREGAVAPPGAALIYGGGGAVLAPERSGTWPRPLLPSGRQAASRPGVSSLRPEPSAVAQCGRAAGSPGPALRFPRGSPLSWWVMRGWGHPGRSSLWYPPSSNTAVFLSTHVGDVSCPPGTNLASSPFCFFW